MAEMHNEQRVLGVHVLGGASESAAGPLGAVDDYAYSDVTGVADGSLISLLKGIYVQNEAIIALLTSIDNKTPEA